MIGNQCRETEPFRKSSLEWESSSVLVSSLRMGVCGDRSETGCGVKKCGASVSDDVMFDTNLCCELLWANKQLYKRQT